jgi:hypothetical protein
MEVIQMIFNYLSSCIATLRDKVFSMGRTLYSYLETIYSGMNKILGTKLGTVDVGRAYGTNDVWYITGYTVLKIMGLLWVGIFIVFTLSDPTVVKRDWRLRIRLALKRRISWGREKVEALRVLQNRMFAFITTPGLLLTPYQSSLEAACRRYRGDFLLYHRLIEFIFEIFPYYLLVLRSLKTSRADDSKLSWLSKMWRKTLNVRIALCERICLVLRKDRYRNFYMRIRRQRDFAYLLNELPQPVYQDGVLMDWVSLEKKVDYYAMLLVFLTRRWQVMQDDPFVICYKKIFWHYKKLLISRGHGDHHARAIEAYESECLASGTLWFKEYLVDVAAGKTVCDWEKEFEFVEEMLSFYWEYHEMFRRPPRWFK